VPDIYSLNGDEIPLELPEQGIALLAPGLIGQVTYHGKRERGQIRAITQEKDALDTALAEAELVDRHTIKIDAPTPEVLPGGAVRRVRDLAEDEIELEVPCGLNEVQFVLYADEDGILSLHIPQLTDRQPALTRVSFNTRLYTYRIRLRQPTRFKLGKQETRGIIGVVAQKLIKVIVGKALKGVAGLGEYAAVKLWEDNARAAQGFHCGSITQLLADQPMSFADWQSLNLRRALLFLHGTTSTTHGAFDGFRQFTELADQLYRLYNGHVLGFNHHTLSKSVAENVIDFYAALPASPASYEFDVIAHSRGGLVARSIAELSDDQISSLVHRAWARPAGVKVRFNRIVFVGTPNNGTSLADPENLPVILDRLANAIHMLPDAPLTLALGGVFAAAAYLSEIGLRVLPGLADQAPRSALVTKLNNPGTRTGCLAQYFGVEADFYPDAGIAAAILEKGVDKLFHDEANDLIVPTLGVSRVGRLDLPTNQVKKYDQYARVYHTSYFLHESTWTSILAFLK